MTPYLRSLAGRCFKQAADVEDAVQDVLLTIHLVRHAYDPTRPFGPWLVAIANRRIIDRLRRDTRRRAREVALSADHETFADPATNLQKDTPDEAALARAIGRLPADQRQTIRMLKLNEMSLKEAAVASGRSVPALKVATHQAVTTLRRILKQRGVVRLLCGTRRARLIAGSNESSRMSPVATSSSLPFWADCTVNTSALEFSTEPSARRSGLPFRASVSSLLTRSTML